jgi:hypothetical protein
MKKTIHHIVLLILSILGIVFLNIGFMFVILGFLPTLIAYFVDETPQMDLYKTVRAANLAGALPTFILLTKSDHPAAVLQIAMNDPNTWLMVYASSLCGWILIGLTQWVTYISMVASGEARIKTLEAAQKDMVEEWGEELREFTISTQ